MKRINKFIKSNIKTVIAFILGLVVADGYCANTNKSYYLYKTASNGVNNYQWWTMSPAGFDTNRASAWRVGTSGDPSLDFVDYAFRLRPVINLKADVQVTGSGTVGSPYLVQ